MALIAVRTAHEETVWAEVVAGVVGVSVKVLPGVTAGAIVGVIGTSRTILKAFEAEGASSIVSSRASTTGASIIGQIVVVASDAVCGVILAVKAIGVARAQEIDSREVEEETLLSVGIAQAG